MASAAQRPAIIWRSPLLRLALLAVPAWFTIAVLIFRGPVSIKLIVGFVLAASLASPVAGLLTVAALAPLGTLLALFGGDGLFRMSEAVVLAFFTGWLLRALKDRPGPGAPSTIGWLLAFAVAASVGGISWQFRRYPGELAETGQAAVLRVLPARGSRRVPRRRAPGGRPGIGSRHGHAVSPAAATGRHAADGARGVSHRRDGIKPAALVRHRARGDPGPSRAHRLSRQRPCRRCQRRRQLLRHDAVSVPGHGRLGGGQPAGAMARRRVRHRRGSLAFRVAQRRGGGRDRDRAGGRLENHSRLAALDARDRAGAPSWRRRSLLAAHASICWSRIRPTPALASGRSSTPRASG